MPFVGFSTTSFVALALLSPPLLILLGTSFLHVNDLIILKNRALRNRSNIAVSLQKRVDLLPRLEECVTLAMRQEKQLQHQLATLRGQCSEKLAQQFDALRGYLSDELASVGALLARMETYPRLRSDAHFKKFLRRLIIQGNELALAKDSYNYNDAVKQYRARRDRLIAAVLCLEVLDYLQTEMEFRNPPDALR